MVVQSVKPCINCSVKESRENEFPVPAPPSICLHVLYFSLQVTPCLGYFGKWLASKTGARSQHWSEAELRPQAKAAHREQRGKEQMAGALLPLCLVRGWEFVCPKGCNLGLSEPQHSRSPSFSPLSKNLLEWGQHIQDGKPCLCAWRSSVCSHSSIRPTVAIRFRQVHNPQPLIPLPDSYRSINLTSLTLQCFYLESDGSRSPARELLNLMSAVTAEVNVGKEFILGSCSGSGSRKLLLTAQAPSSSCCLCMDVLQI